MSDSQGRFVYNRSPECVGGSPKLVAAQSYFKSPDDFGLRPDTAGCRRAVSDSQFVASVCVECQSSIECIGSFRTCGSETCGSENDQSLT